MLKINTVVKAIIFAEMVFWSGWNFVMPIFAIYVSKLPNGSIEKAASSFSFYMLARVIVGLATGKYLTKKRTRHKFFLTIFGIALLSICYIGLGLANSMAEIYFFYILIGIGLGMVNPAKNSLFSSNLTNEKATQTWSILDAGVFLSMAAAAAIGGSIAGKYGFRVLFFMAAITNLLAIIPYVVYIQYWRKKVQLSKILS